MRRLLLLLLIAAPLSAQTVTLLHFSDYHSHAVPFYTERGAGQGGIARAIHYLRREKQKGALVFSGGDMINKGAPAWSDKYRCAEWPWLNGIADAMALGNHELDYGTAEFHKCVSSLAYPVLSANTTGFRKSIVLAAGGARIGVFAVAGPDFSNLMKEHAALFGDRVEAARGVVAELRGNVDAIVMIGHEHAEDDYALARAVPGIDLIFGSHSHHLRELTKIEGTNTWFISPGQYLTHISRVELTIGGGVKGQLVPVDAKLGEDRNVARKVRRMQRDLERDSQYRELFAKVATLEAPLSLEQLAQRTLEAMRQATDADVAISTTSSFRQPLPAGPLTLEELRAALPYDNEIAVCTMNAGALQRLIADKQSYVRGADVKKETYRVATTDYLAFVAYKLNGCERTGKRVREELRKRGLAAGR
jgi:5'-nucleotidase/UDP-sugar diphosphatase